jgi:DNA-directed RNA polymerase subunit N (RpoN/RPB10)
MDRVISKNVHPDEKIPDELLIKVHCCREWIVSAINSWGRCNICGTKPERKWD